MKRPSFFCCRLIWIQHSPTPSTVTGQRGPLSVLSLTLSFLCVVGTVHNMDMVKSAKSFLRTKDIITWVINLLWWQSQELCGSFALQHKYHNAPVAAQFFTVHIQRRLARNLGLLLLCSNYFVMFTACRTNETVQPVLPPLKKEVKKRL